MVSKSHRGRTLLISAVVLVVVALSFGLGLGLGLKKHASSTSPSSSSISTSSGTNSSSAASNVTLATVSKAQLVRAVNFAPGVRWNVSESPRTREYNWTVEEVWAAPGGVLKKMVVVNGE